MKRMNEVKEKSSLIGDVRGSGLMVGIEMVEDKVRKFCFSNLDSLPLVAS